ncbi:MAG: PAS domain S-box protein [Polyangiaceae bacterium]|nr:PAS domain S-box protein [Polyangiaceae bacterium]
MAPTQDPPDILAHERFRRVFEDGPLATALVTREHGFIEVNAAFERLFGYTNAELRGMTFRDLTHPDHVADNLAQVARLQRGEVPLIRTEKRYLTKSGEVFWAQTTVVVVRDPAGQAVDSIAVITDLTERKRAEEALRASEELYRRLVERLHVGVFLSTPDGRFVHTNPATSQLCGWSAEELLELPASRLYADAEDRAALVHALRTEGSVRDREFRSQRKDGTTYPIRMSAVLLHDHEGRPESILGIVEDVTERKRADEALVRTQRLESLGVLAGGIAHDFNNLLAAIFGYVDLARNTASEPAVQTYLERALTGFERATALTKQLLTFAKGGVPTKQVAALGPLVRQAVGFALSGSRADAHLRLPDELWACEIDPNQIAQVVHNVVLNALQAMPSGGHLEVTADNERVGPDELAGVPAGDYVHLAIRDDGPGIAPDVLPRVFDPFFTTKPSGTGLGLATAYSIVRRHDGVIDVESAPGAGTTFHVRLPATRRTAPAPHPTAPLGHRGSGTFLVLDDEDLVRGAVGAMLRAMGYAPVFACDGAEALGVVASARARGEWLAGALLDLTIPGRAGGREIVVELRALDATLRLFAMSGYSDDPVIAEPTKFGFTGSLAKPLSLGGLAALLEAHLAR